MQDRLKSLRPVKNANEILVEKGVRAADAGADCIMSPRGGPDPFPNVVLKSKLVLRGTGVQKKEKGL